MSTSSAKWLLLGGLVLTLATGGAVLVAAPVEHVPVRERIKAPVPKAAEGEWKEGEPITFQDGGRVTGVAFAPSGKTFAVCRADGKIDFFDPVTRKHQRNMNFLGDPKANPNREGGTYPAIAFRPRPHAKLGDVFAVTHKNGVNFGTANIGLLVDEPQVAVDDVPANWVTKGFDPHQVTWVGDGLVTSNGAETQFRSTDGTNSGYRGWADNKHKPTVLAAGGTALAYSFNNEPDGKPDPFDPFVIDPDAKPFPQIRRVSGHKTRPTADAVSTDGKRIVTADEGGTVIVWEGEELNEKRRIELGDGVVQLAFAPDGRTVAVMRRAEVTTLSKPAWAGTEVALFVFDVNNPPKQPSPLWKTDPPLRGTFTGTASLAFSPDGKTLLAAFADPYTDDPKERGGVPKSLGVKVWERTPKK